jgi:hypothetical protein
MLIRLVLFSMALQILNQPPQPQPTEADFAWVERQISAARDQLMPMGVDKPEQLQWQAAAYRATKDRFTDMAESYFSIDRVYRDQSAPTKEALIATVLKPAGNVLAGELYRKSIRDQLLDLHIADRTASLEALLLGIKLQRISLTVEQCPAIARRMNALPGMSIALPGGSASRNRGRVVSVPPLHPVSHQVVVSVQGAHINAHFTDPSASVVQWALGTLEDLRKCEGSSR